MPSKNGKTFCNEKNNLSKVKRLKTQILTLSHYSAELTACFAAQMSQTLFPLPLAPSSSRFSSNLSKNSDLLYPHSPIFSNPTFPHPLTFHSKLRISQPTSITPIRSQPMSHSSTNSNSTPIENPRWSLCAMTALVTGGTRGIGYTFLHTWKKRSLRICFLFLFGL